MAPQGDEAPESNRRRNGVADTVACTGQRPLLSVKQSSTAVTGRPLLPPVADSCDRHASAFHPIDDVAKQSTLSRLRLSTVPFEHLRGGIICDEPWVILIFVEQTLAI